MKNRPWFLILCVSAWCFNIVRLGHLHAWTASTKAWTSSGPQSLMGMLVIMCFKDHGWAGGTTSTNDDMLVAKGSVGTLAAMALTLLAIEAFPRFAMSRGPLCNLESITSTQIVQISTSLQILAVIQSFAQQNLRSQVVFTVSGLDLSLHLSRTKPFPLPSPSEGKKSRHNSNTHSNWGISNF